MKKIVLPILILIAANTFLFARHLPQTDKALNNNIIVLINFNVDTSYFLNTAYDTMGIRLAYEIFGEQLTYNLDNDFIKSQYNVSFYTKNEIEKYELDPDLIVNVSLTNLDNPASNTSSYSVQLSSDQHFAENTVYGINSFTGTYSGSRVGSFGPPGALGPYYSYGSPLTVSQHLQSLHASATFSTEVTNAHSNAIMLTKKIKAKYESYIEFYNNDMADSETENIFEALYKKLYHQIRTEVLTGLKEFNSDT